MTDFAVQKPRQQPNSAQQAQQSPQLLDPAITPSAQGLRDAQLQESRGTAKSLGMFSNALNIPPALASSAALTGMHIHQLEKRLEKSLNGQAITHENILSNPEARQIKLEINAATFALSSIVRSSLAVENGGIASHASSGLGAGGLLANRSGALGVRSNENIELLQADLSDALKGKPATRQNILADAKAREIQLRIIEETSRQAQLVSSALNQASGPRGVAAIGSGNRDTVKLSNGNGMSAQVLSTYKIDIYKANMREALGEISATPENIVANREARRAQRLIISELAATSAATLANPFRGGAALSPTGNPVSSTNSANILSDFSETFKPAPTLRLLEVDLQEALKGAPPIWESIISNPEAREVQYQILALRQQHVLAASQALQGGAAPNSSVPRAATASLPARTFIQQQMMALSQAELADALGGADPTPENIAGNSRAFAAFQRLRDAGSQEFDEVWAP